MALTEGILSTLPADSLGHSFEGGVDDNGRMWARRIDPNLSTKVALWGPNNNALLTNTNPGVVNNAGANQLLLDGQVVFAANAVINTSITQDVNLPAVTHPLGYSYIAVTNPSAVTALTLIFQNKESYSFTGTAVIHYTEVTRITLPVNKPEGMVYIIQGWLMGDGARLVVSNNAAADATGITCSFKIRKF